MERHTVWPDENGGGVDWVVFSDGQRRPAICGGDGSPLPSIEAKYCPIHKDFEFKILKSRKVQEIVGEEVSFEYCPFPACEHLNVLSPLMEVISLSWEKRLALFTTGRLFVFMAKFSERFEPDNR